MNWLRAAAGSHSNADDVEVNKEQEFGIKFWIYQA